VLVLARVPGPHDDYLVLFISSQLRTAVQGTDVVLDRQHPAFATSGLKVPSVLRIGKLATISNALIVGPLGKIDDPWLANIVQRIVDPLERACSLLLLRERRRLKPEPGAPSGPG
jgi:mRNA interferase MazF